MIRNLGEKSIAFLNFTSVVAAIRCVNALRSWSHRDPQWLGVKVNYARDKCSPQGAVEEPKKATVGLESRILFRLQD